MKLIIRCFSTLFIVCLLEIFDLVDTRDNFFSTFPRFSFTFTFTFTSTFESMKRPGSVQKLKKHEAKLECLMRFLENSPKTVSGVYIGSTWKKGILYQILACSIRSVTVFTNAWTIYFTGEVPWFLRLLNWHLLNFAFSQTDRHTDRLRDRETERRREAERVR